MLTVRRARRADLAAIARMARRLARAVDDPRPSISSRMLDRLLFGRDRWSVCLVACDAREPVGYVLASRHFEGHTGTRHLKIADLYVAESARGHGAGRRLFSAVRKEALRLGCRELTWEVWKENAAAYRFYERLGAEHARDVSLMRIAAKGR